MIFTGRAINGSFLPDSPSMLEQHLMEMEGKKISIETKRVFNRRSNQQNKYLWAVPYKMIANELSKRLNRLVTPEDVHREMSEKYNGETETLINQATGETDNFKIIKRSSDDSTVEFEKRCEWLRRWAATYLGLDIPTPNELINDQDGLQEIME